LFVFKACLKWRAMQNLRQTQGIPNNVHINLSIAQVVAGGHGSVVCTNRRGAIVSSGHSTERRFYNTKHGSVTVWEGGANPPVTITPTGGLVAPTHGVPGPIAGAGVPALALVGGIYWLVRRRRSPKAPG
jgi:hypothetical protein